MAGFDLVEKYLEQCRELALAGIMSLLPAGGPRRHLYDLVSSYPKRGGKGLRPGLCIGTCRAFGGSTVLALNSAIAIELFHNAFLVHDDVEDGSEYRRGLPTLHAEHGLAIAVNVGDAMNVLSIRPLMHNLSLLGPELTWRVFSEVEHMVRQSVEGQAMELGWVRDNQCDLSEEDYLRMTLKKTCWYTAIHPCRIGALIATSGACDLDAFNRFGFYMGAAFQIQDDLLNLTGDRAKYGKEIGGDIWEGKRTLMLIHLLNQANPEEKKRLVSFLGTPRNHRSARDVRWVYSLMENYGCFEHARSAARQLAEAALGEFQLAYKDAIAGPDKEFLQSVVLYMIERDL